jgi:hypothetical protein
LRYGALDEPTTEYPTFSSRIHTTWVYVAPLARSQGGVDVPDALAGDGETFDVARAAVVTRRAQTNSRPVTREGFADPRPRARMVESTSFNLRPAR